MDLSDDSNRIHFQLNGRKEDFPGGTLSDTIVSRSPRWFRFGSECVIDVERQRQICRELTGSIPVNEKGTLLSEGAPRETITRRTSLHRKFYTGAESECISYMSRDVPHVAYRYLSLWDNVKLTDLGNDNKHTAISRRSFESEDLDTIAADFRMMLMCSNCIGRMQVVGNAVRAGARTASNYLPAAVVVTPSVRRAPPVTGRPSTNTTLDIATTSAAGDTTRISAVATTAMRAYATGRPATATMLDVAATSLTSNTTHASAMATNVAATPSPANNTTPAYATRLRSTLSTALAYGGVLRAPGGGNDGEDSFVKRITYALPQQLTLSNLRCTTKEGLVDMKQVERLASFEFMFHSHLKGKSSTTIQEEMKRMKLAIPRDFMPEWFADGNLTIQSINSGKKNIKQARKE